MLIRAIAIFAIINSISGENKFMNSVRNLTINSNVNQTKQNTVEGNVLKSEIAKYLNECKSDLTYNYYSNEDEGRDKKYDSRNPNFHQHNKEHKRSDRDNKNFDDGDINGYLTSYRSNDQDQRRQQKGSCSNNDEERHHNARGNNDYYWRNNENTRTNKNFGGRSNRPQGGRINPYDSGNDYYNYHPDNYSPPRNYGDTSNSNQREYHRYNSRGMSNYPVSNEDLIRWKREGDNIIPLTSKGGQCLVMPSFEIKENTFLVKVSNLAISPHRIGNMTRDGWVIWLMDISMQSGSNLDESSMPSETATIKFLQDKMSNDRKRVKLIRDTRRCFAKLAVTEHGDGCELSKILARCLKLNTE